MKKFKIAIASLSLLLILSACTSKNKDEGNDTSHDGVLVQSSESNPVVTMTMMNRDTITIELYHEVAPNTVNNFIALIEDGFYDGLTFHRIIPGFMIQGGDPEGNGTGNPGYSIPGEFSSNKFDNKLKHERGVISMARAQDPNSAGSQFFIMHDDNKGLDGEYAAFGLVIDGMDVVDKIASTETVAQDRPAPDHEQIIQKIRVDLKGETYQLPNKTN